MTDNFLREVEVEQETYQNDLQQEKENSDNRQKFQQIVEAMKQPEKDDSQKLGLERDLLTKERKEEREQRKVEWAEYEAIEQEKKEKEKI